MLDNDPEQIMLSSSASKWSLCTGIHLWPQRVALGLTLQDGLSAQDEKTKKNIGTSNCGWNDMSVVSIVFMYF